MSGASDPLDDITVIIRRERPADAARRIAGLMKERLSNGELGLLPVILGLIAIWTYFGLQAEAFLSARNLSNLVLQTAVLGTIALGTCLVLLLGEIDLSVGSVAGVTSAVLGVLVTNEGMAWYWAILLMLLVGGAIGIFQGAWVAYLRVPSFVVTLAGLLAWQGLQLNVLGETGTVNVLEPNISSIATSFLSDEAGWIIAVVGLVGYAATRLVHEARRRKAGLVVTPTLAVVLRTALMAGVLLAIVAVLNDANGVPYVGLILFALVIVFSLITTRTKFGRYIYAVGSNAEAARRAGINVNRIRVAVFGLASVLAGVGALLAVSRGAAATTQTGGGTLLLEAVAAAVIGGTSLFGGRGTVWAALMGAFVIGSVSNGLDLLGQPADVKLMVEGAILLLAVTVDALARRSRAPT
jgi:D-xylose transport system permease protein